MSDFPFAPLLPMPGSLTSPLPPPLIVGERALPLSPPMVEVSLPMVN
jgi:hypothetical protein